MGDGSGYAVLCIRAERSRQKVKLGVDPGSKDTPPRLSKLWVENKDGEELATVLLPRKADLNEAADLLLEQLRHNA